MDYRVQLVIRMMRDDLRRDLPLDEMARATQLSRMHLCRLFKAATGMTPVQFRKALRTRRAQELLETSFLRIKEVRSAAGFSDPSHFARDFRRATGRSPVQYRAERFAVPDPRMREVESEL